MLIRLISLAIAQEKSTGNGFTGVGHVAILKNPHLVWNGHPFPFGMQPFTRPFELQWSILLTLLVKRQSFLTPKTLPQKRVSFNLKIHLRNTAQHVGTLTVRAHSTMGAARSLLPSLGSRRELLPSEWSRPH